MGKWILTIATLLSITLGEYALEAQIHVMAFAGSTRKDSINKKLLQEAARIAHELGANVVVVDLKDYPLPLYDADLEKAEGMPENAKFLRNLMLSSQVILISTPNYNHSIPAVLKNALDWISRSEKAERSREAYQGRIFALMSASPGRGGGANAIVHLRDILEDQRAILISKQVSVPNAYEAFDEQGHLKDAATHRELQKLIEEALNKASLH